jgi:hypothetical protein
MVRGRTPATCETPFGESIYARQTRVLGIAIRSKRPVDFLRIAMGHGAGLLKRSLAMFSSKRGYSSERSIQRRKRPETTCCNAHWQYLLSLSNVPDNTGVAIR